MYFGLERVLHPMTNPVLHGNAEKSITRISKYLLDPQRKALHLRSTLLDSARISNSKKSSLRSTKNGVITRTAQGDHKPSSPFTIHSHCPSS